jgi:hypothetical protein
MRTNEQVEEVFAAYREDQSFENAKALRKIASEGLLQGNRTGRFKAAVGPALAIMDILDEEFDYGWQTKVVCWVMRKLYLKQDSPGLNDYYMGRWMILHRIEDAVAIHQRAYHAPTEWEWVGFTGQWMVNSMCGQNEEFDMVMVIVESECLTCNPPKNLSHLHYCGCCGRRMSGNEAVVARSASEPDYWCVDCQEHVDEKMGQPACDRIYYAQHDKPCPFEEGQRNGYPPVV